ncbi:hypothetical protein BG006_004216 [Podila minutissima]|uniref:Uncharacterized protein n=1 Tax=Podila minutissima TaxID=64525 RepID=A0A9P5S872_9FUNG|nr:hypothetical protein BG006_004216 [Podila minutissima]
MKQYVKKPYKEPEHKAQKPKPKPKPKPMPKLLSDLTSKTDKLKITQLLAYQHPTTSLYIGTLSANVKQAPPKQNGLQQQVMSVHLKAASEAVHVKHQGQTLIGTYIEYLANKGLERLDAEDWKFLDLLCPRVSMNDVKNDTDDAMEDDKDGDEIVGLVEEDNEEEEDADEDNMDLGGPGRDDKLMKRVSKGQLDRSDAEIQIQSDLSAIENYLTLNKLAQNSRRIVPMTTSKQPYIRFSERELAGFFFKNGGELKERLMDVVSKDGVSPTLADVQGWIGKKEPGFLIKNFIANINPKNLTS